MANQTIPQTSQFCKVQNNPKVTAISRLYSKSSNLCLRECARVMMMKNDDAVEFLKTIGFSQVVPGTHFAPMHDYAKFFGVKEDCFYAYMQRHGMNRTDNPREAFSSDLRVFFRRAGLLNHGKFVEGENNKPGSGGVFDFHFENLDTHYVTDYRWSVRFYSARTALSMIPLMYRHFSKRDKEHRTVYIYEELMSYVAQLEADAALKKEAKAAKSTESAEVKPSTTLSKDELFDMVKRAVREVMSEAKVELSAPITITT